MFKISSTLEDDQAIPNRPLSFVPDLFSPKKESRRDWLESIAAFGPLQSHSCRGSPVIIRPKLC